MKVYCFGNEFVKEDALAKEIASELAVSGIEFVACVGPEELPLEEEKLVILDVAKGIDKTVVLSGLDDLDKLKEKACMSCHDIDLAFFLKLLKKTGSLKSVKIIAIPQEGNKEEIKKDVIELLT